MAAQYGETSFDYAAAMQTAPVGAGDWLVAAAILLCLLGGTFLVMFRKQHQLQVVVGNLVLALSVLANLALLIRVVTTGPVVMTFGNWLPPFGISFVADGMSALFALTASICALAGGIYAIRDLDAWQWRFGFYPMLLIMLAGVMGAFLTGDIFNLYVWFEVLLIASFGLIILGNTKAQLDGGVKYAILNLLATTFFLIAVGLIYGVVGSLNMADIATKLPLHYTTAPVATIAVLFLVGFGMKGAAFPLSFWLPASYHTPNISVAAIFAGLLTKVGVYALIRTFTLIMPGEVGHINDILLVIAIFTMVVGAIGALAQSDLRRLLGFLVVSGIGYMLLGLSIGSEGALGGAIFYALHSMVIMTILYFLAGLVKRRAGSFYLHEAGGLYAKAPFMAGLFLVAVLAASGLPPFSGFWPKYMLVEASLAAESYVAVGAILLAGFISTIALGRAWAFLFWRNGAAGAPEKEVAELTVLDGRTLAIFILPVTVLSLLIVLFGIWPEPLMATVYVGVDGLINPAGYIQSVLGGN